MESLISVGEFLIIVSSSFPTEFGALETDVLKKFCQKQVLATAQDGLFKATKSLLGNWKKKQQQQQNLR